MKQKLLLFTVFLALYLLPAEAKKVSPQKAEIVASKLVTTATNSLRTSPPSLTLVHTQVENKIGTRSASNTANPATYYVFNKGNNSGFIIVSADDVASPILGYTNTGNYDASNLPVNFAGWTENLSDEIAYAIDNNLKQDSEIKELWDNYLSGNSTQSEQIGAVEPLLKTTWNQGQPYNALAPGGSYTGCVATAMAQIMKYYNYPSTRTVTIPGYTSSASKYVISPVAASSYAWSNMLNNYDYYGSYPEANKTAVAKIMYDCGVSLTMNYTTSGSGASSSKVGEALINYFDYDKSIQVKEHYYYSKQEWEDILYTEIKARRPVHYSGMNYSSGHAFVCDGYDNSGFFHFNWGWGGLYDGYFITTALNPGTGGAGSGQGTYNQLQMIITNIKPNEGGEYKLQLTLDKATDLKIEKSTLDRGESVVVEGIIWNKGYSVFSGECGIALVDANDNILNIIGQSTNTINSQSGIYTKYIYATIPKSMATGNYFLRIASKEVGASDWTLLKGGTGYASKVSITIDDSRLSISSLVFHESIDLSVSQSSLTAGDYFIMSGYLWNKTQSSLSGNYAVAIVDNNDQIVAIGGERTFNLSPFYYTYLTNIYAQVPATVAPGNYFVRAITKEQGQSDWALVKGGSSYVYRVPITVVGETRSTIQPSINGDLSALNIYTSQGTIHATLSNESSIKEVSVYNLSGALVYSTQVNAISFASNHTFIPGTYIVKVKTDAGIETKKILIK